ncbi:MAG: VacJ family lipoprotein [Alphaproteobacteria bacterium]|nr:VacJ family lipoprotein [Alphaproteobacteria bacterium]
MSDPKEDQSALESYNHAMFNFNNKVEKAVIRPVAKGYRAITNDYIRQRVTNFFNNISEPVSAANHLLQGEWHNAAQNVSRLMINTTIGGLGLYDVAAKAGLEQKPTGFDETMAAWCVPDGPYIVLPLIGPSTPRAATGWVADGYSSPAYWVASESDGEDAMLVYYGANGLKYLNKYATNLKLLEGLEESAVDYYETVKAIYLQNRGKIKTCGKVSAENTPDYDFDMDSED